jgi:hypothetical protein
MIATEDDLATHGARHRTHVDDVIGSAHHFFIVLHHDHGVTQVAQFLQHLDQAQGVTRVKADAGLVQDVHAPTKLLPKEVARSMRCVSPPLKVLLRRSKVRVAYSDIDQVL